MADIPGLIEGAHEGRGLGVRFLKHVERTRLLVHLIDVADRSGRDPVEEYHVILSELAGFNPEVATKPMLLVASRIDAAGDGARLESLRHFARELGEPLFEISAVTGQGLEELKRAIWKRLDLIPRPVDRRPADAIEPASAREQ